MKKRILSMLIVLSMVISIMPLSSLAASAATSDEVQSLKAAPESVKESADDFYGLSNANDDEWISTSCSFISDALSTLPVSGMYEKIGVWAGEQFLNILMGSNDTDRTDEILDAIKQLNNQNQTTLLKLDQLTDLVKDQYQLNYINKYYNGENELYALTKLYMGALQNTEGKTDEQIEESRRQILTYDIPEKSSSDINSLSSLSDYDKMVLAWGGEIKSTVYLNDGTCSVIELMNNFALKHFKWEHQGYEMRENYYSSLISLYVSSSNLMQASLNARIEVYEAATGKEAATLRQALKDLCELNKEIQKLGKAAEVNRLDDNIRHYQVSGHDVYMYAKTTKQTLPYKNAGRREDFKCPDGRKANKHWDSFYMYTDSKTGTVIEGLESKYYKYIYDDYNPTGSTETVSLYDIFFSEQEGNMTAPEGINYSGKVTFVSNDVKTEYWRKKNIFGAVTDESWNVYCKLYEAYGEISDRYFGVASFMDAYTQSWHYLPDEYLESFIMVIPATIQNDEVGAGQGEIVTEEIVPFTVKFDANGGSVDIESTVTDMNGYITELPTPIYAGYEFEGWYTAQSNKITTDTQITESTTVYAKWKEIDAKAHTHDSLKHTEAKAATTEAEGNIEYWYCEDCGKYFSDKDGKNEIKLSDTVVAKLTGSSALQTGDNRSIVLLLAILLVSGSVLYGIAVLGKRKAQIKPKQK